MGGSGKAFREGLGKAPLGESLRAFLERTKDCPPLTWLIEGLVPSVGQVWVIAAPGAGKTWFALFLAKSAACADRDVFLIEEEHSERGLHDRFANMAFPENALDRLRVWHRLGLKVGDSKFEALLAEVAAAKRPVVVFDCLAQVLNGKENEADAAASFNDCLKRMVTAHPEALVLVLLHTSKGSERAEGTVAYAGRGSSAFNGAADTELRLRKLPSGKGSGVIKFSLEISKAREFEGGEKRHLTLTMGSGEVAIEEGDTLSGDLCGQVLHMLTSENRPLSKDHLAKTLVVGGRT